MGHFGKQKEYIIVHAEELPLQYFSTIMDFNQIRRIGVGEGIYIYKTGSSGP